MGVVLKLLEQGHPLGPMLGLFNLPLLCKPVPQHFQIFECLLKYPSSLFFKAILDIFGNAYLLLLHYQECYHPCLPNISVLVNQPLAYLLQKRPVS